MGTKESVQLFEKYICIITATTTTTIPATNIEILFQAHSKNLSGCRSFRTFFSSSLQTYIFFSLYSALDLLNNICTFSGTLHVYLIHLFVSFVCVFDVTWQTSKQFANVSLRVLRYRALNTSTYRDFLHRGLPLRYYFSFCNTKKRQTKPNARFM